MEIISNSPALKTNRKSIVFLLFFLSMVLQSKGQNENNHWFFGKNAGLSFNTFPPTALTGGMNTLEGCASVSDHSGNLLFYTDGITVYNSVSGSIMPNGTGLLGSSSSTSSSIIVPKPCSQTEYYIFTVDDITGVNGVNYSLVNMDTNGDCYYDPLTESGMVVSGMKNIHLTGPTGEKICAIKHANGMDYWVITTKRWYSDFYVYLVTQTGISVGPSNLNIGPIIQNYGYLKGSRSGNLLAMANSHSSGNATVELYDFNSSTGIIAHKQSIAPNRSLIYGVEFSNNENWLYFTCEDSLFTTPNAKEVYSFDLNNPNLPPHLIYSSPNIPLVSPNHTYGNLGAAQMAPDGKIYIAKGRTPYLDAILDPEAGGNSYSVNEITLNDTCFLGLPTFIAGDVKSCKPLNMSAYTYSSPTLFSSAIQNILVSDGIDGMDKEYGDVDNDGDVDLLFTINNNLHAIINSAGYCSSPIFDTTTVNLNINIRAYSFRLLDWDLDGAQDLIILGAIPSGPKGIFLYLNNGTGLFPASPSSTLLLDVVDFPFEQLQFIALGDINHDFLPDLLIGGHYTFSSGVEYFENNGSGGFNDIGIVVAGNSSSFPCVEVYDADCQNGLDLLVSNPLYGTYPNGGGGRMFFHQNTGGLPTSGPPPISTTGLTNQFGFNDVPTSQNADLECDWIITRLVDFYNNDCPIAITYNPCNDSIFFYEQPDCKCDKPSVISNLEEVPLSNVSGVIDLFPNPVNDQLNIINHSNQAIKKLRIVDIMGSLVIEMNKPTHSIDVVKLNSGTYLMMFDLEEQMVVKKLVVR